MTRSLVEADREVKSGSSSPPPASNVSRLLVVDDNPDDRALIARELHAELPKLAIKEIDSQAALERALAGDGFDLLITDYQLYWSNGLRIIQQVKERWPDMPVIMFTGTGSEEVAVEAMKAGVQDYVLKSPKHYGRLRTAVQTALKMRRHKLDLAHAEARYKNLFDTVPVGLFRCTPKGKILEANPAFAALAGEMNHDALLRCNFSQLHPRPTDFDAWRDRLERDGAVAFVESKFKGRKGQTRWVQIHAKAFRDPENGQVYYEGSVEDITDRKKAEAEREKLIGELSEALAKVKTLSGLLPICSSCKKIRDREGDWNVLETYIEKHSLAHFTHSFCPECANRLYPEIFLDRPKF